MNLLTSFKNLLTRNSSRVRQKRCTEDVCLNTLQAMQAVCSKLPDGKIFVSMGAGEFSLYLQWNADEGMQLPRQAFELAERVSTNELWISSFHTWMLGLTAQWMNLPGRKHANSVMPILISTRQGMGKSTFCRSLMPAVLRRYYTDSYDLSAQSSCELKLATFGLINIDEFDKLSSKKTPLLKNLMQMKDLNIRKAYSKMP